MNMSEVNKLHHGIYRVFWRNGKSSLAAVGSNDAYQRWLAPINWTRLFDSDVAPSWRGIEKVILIAVEEDQQTR